MTTIIKNGRIIDPSKHLDFIGDILIEKNIIAALASHIDGPLDARVINASGMVVSPGFIDLHCHLREPGYEHKETILTGTRAAVKGGFTTICAMPNTNPDMDNIHTIETVKKIAESYNLARVLPIACVTLGRRGEVLVDMDKLATTGIIGFSDDGNPVSSDKVMNKALLRTIDLGLPIINHCENLAISNGGVVNEGRISDLFELKGWPSIAEDVMVERDISLAERTHGKLHIAHVSTKESANLIRLAKDRGVDITAEVTPHHLTLTEDWVETRQNGITAYNTNAKVNPPLRTLEDVDALIAAVSEGVIDCIATDHAPHSLEDKSTTFDEAAFGITGLETALASLLPLVSKKRISMNTLIDKLTNGPRKLLRQNSSGSGTLNPGALADITIFDTSKEWTVNADYLESMGKNTPLYGLKLRGQVIFTILNGNLVYDQKGVANA